jgi:hypothetical protein
MPLYTSPSFRHGLPESRLHGRAELTIHGPGYPLPGGYDGLVYNGMLIKGLVREKMDKCRLQST